MDWKKAEAEWMDERRDAIQKLAAPQRAPLPEGDYLVEPETYHRFSHQLYAHIPEKIMSDQLYPGAHMGDPKPQPIKQHPATEETMAQTPAEIKIKVRSDAETRRLRAFAIDSAARVFAGDPMPPQPGHQAEDIVEMAKKFMEYIETGEA